MTPSEQSECERTLAAVGQELDEIIRWIEKQRSNPAVTYEIQQWLRRVMDRWCL